MIIKNSLMNIHWELWKLGLLAIRETGWLLQNYFKAFTWIIFATVSVFSRYLAKFTEISQLSTANKNKSAH